MNDQGMIGAWSGAFVKISCSHNPFDLSVSQKLFIFGEIQRKRHANNGIRKEIY